ncbi:hypothetical protein KQX54_012428 [Cotesia glomerata]|uniref:Uncharacterized protein n=1 Tax=Cotesia glomerata TaxID=32391 RepID=A0AAV7IKW3_COTGL|nr:hypothetical protein KQX54_012428 [Cotesia glomerata]
MDDRRKYFIFLFTTLITLISIGSISYLLLSHISTVDVMTARFLDSKKFRVEDCKDIKVFLTDLGGGRFWLKINQFYNVQYYDFEFNYDEEAIESIVSREFDVRHLVKDGRRISFVTNNVCGDYSEFRHLHSVHDYETKTSLLISKNLTVNGIIFNKYHIRNINNGKHIVIELKNTVDTYGEIYYDNLLEAKEVNGIKNGMSINLNINVDYSKNNKILKTDVRIMNILIYWNAVAMLFSGLNQKFNIKIKKLNFAETAGVLFPKEPSMTYTLFGIYRSINNYFSKNRVSVRDNVDIQVAMTTADICLRAVAADCDIKGYTLLLSDVRPSDKLNIAVINYSPLLLNYNLGAREIAHSLGVKYEDCEGIMNRDNSRQSFTWCEETLPEFRNIEEFIEILRMNGKSHRNSHIPLSLNY